MTNVRYGETDPAQRNLENDFYAILGGNIGPVIPFIADGELDIWRMVASAVQSDVGPVLLLAGNRFQSASVLFEYSQTALPQTPNSKVSATATATTKATATATATATAAAQE